MSRTLQVDITGNAIDISLQTDLKLLVRTIKCEAIGTVQSTVHLVAAQIFQQLV